LSILNVTGGAASRQADVRFISECVESARCCAIVGLSNFGKSDLMRAMRDVEVAHPTLFVYIDFNLMLSVSEQGFYELILRSVLAALETHGATQALVDRVRQAYAGIVSPSSAFAAALSFMAGLDAVIRDLNARLVLLCDEFDEPFAALDGRTFLNLRALYDRAPEGIVYVTATGQRLSEMRHDTGASEFAELFAYTTHFVRPLEGEEARRFAQRIASDSGVGLESDELDFLWAQAGGHPGLLEVASRVLVQAHQLGVAEMPAERRLPYVRNLLDNDLNVRTECAKLWNDLSEAEHAALTRFLDAPEDADGDLCDPLLERGIIVRGADRMCRVFGELFRAFADRQRRFSRPGPHGVRVDADAGEVWVDGRLLPDLTAQEYRLLLLLYGNLDKICDKNKIVEAVWSEAYLDTVDDARIEKLVSRLRQKLEPHPDEPRYLVTVRGRGYKLARGD
jgi:hypothetical protein